jgi:hypothetical protein
MDSNSPEKSRLLLSHQYFHLPFHAPFSTEFRHIRLKELPEDYRPVLCDFHICFHHMQLPRQKFELEVLFCLSLFCKAFNGLVDKFAMKDTISALIIES